jgi:transcriptional regulator with XRE-family HTH domain
MTQSVTVAALPGAPARLTSPSPSASDRALAIFGGLVLAAELISGTNSYAVPESVEPSAVVNGRWTNNGTWDVGIVNQIITARTVSGRSLQSSVLLLRDMSGLTWEQLAKLFGVSRRAIHLWASGGRMNSAHSERLNAILSAIQHLEADTAEQRRQMLLAPRADGRSLYEGLLEGRRKSRGVNAPAFRPEQLVEALHDRLD